MTYKEGYQNGRADKLLGIVSMYAYCGTSFTNETGLQEYSHGYRDAMNGLPCKECETQE